MANRRRRGQGWGREREGEFSREGGGVDRVARIGARGLRVGRSGPPLEELCHRHIRSLLRPR